MNEQMKRETATKVAALLRGAVELLREVGPWVVDNEMDPAFKRLFDMHSQAFEVGDEPYQALCGLIRSTGMTGLVGLELQRLKVFPVSFIETVEDEVLPETEFEEDESPVGSFNTFGLCEDCGASCPVSLGVSVVRCRNCGAAYGRRSSADVVPFDGNVVRGRLEVGQRSDGGSVQFVR